MNKAIRRRVVGYESRPNDGPSAHLWPLCWTAVLECGHRINQGVSDLRPKWKACHECGFATINGRRVQSPPPKDC